MISVAPYPPPQDPLRIEALKWHLQALGNLQISSLKKADLIICMDMSKLQSLSRAARRKTITADPLMSADMAGALNRAILKHMPKEDMADAHFAKFKAWAKTRMERNEIQVFGPGPSGNFQKMKHALNIISGAFVVKSALEASMPIDAIVMSDSLALTGISGSVNSLHKDIIALQYRDQCALITTLANAAVLSPHWPDDLQNLLIGVPESKIHTPSQSFSDLYASFPTGNVLTALILPVATYFKAPIALYGFDGALDAPIEGNQKPALTHKNSHAQDAHKMDILRVNYGGGYLFSDGYLDTVQANVNHYIYNYQKRGHVFSAPNWTPPTHRPSQNSLKVKLYAATEFADTHPRIIAGGMAAIATLALHLGAHIMNAIQNQALSSGLFYGLFFAGLFLFIGAFLHLRKRAKRLADIAERRASEKAHRAFEAQAKRLDAIEAKLNK